MPNDPDSAELTVLLAIGVILSIPVGIVFYFTLYPWIMSYLYIMGWVTP